MKTMNWHKQNGLTAKVFWAGERAGERAGGPKIISKQKFRDCCGIGHTFLISQQQYQSTDGRRGRCTNIHSKFLTKLSENKCQGQMAVPQCNVYAVCHTTPA